MLRATSPSRTGKARRAMIRTRRAGTMKAGMTSGSNSRAGKSSSSSRCAELYYSIVSIYVNTVREAGPSHEKGPRDVSI